MFAEVIQTKTGRAIDPFCPKPEQISLEDIAWALSNTCRFAGHCNSFYSVAQHTMRMVRELEQEGHCQAATYALLHDASEAYLCDIPSPVKRHPEMAFYRRAEQCLTAIIHEAFGLAWPAPDEITKSVKRADLRMLATECRDLVTPSPEIVWEDLPEPYARRIFPAPPEQVYWEFLSMLNRRFA